MNNNKDVPVPINGIWESPLAQYVHKLVSENWTELRDTLSELEFEVRLGKIQGNDVPFTANLHKDCWLKYMKMFDGASKCSPPFFKRSGRIMYDVFFHGDVRVIVEEINGKYEVSKVERKTRDFGQKQTFRTSMNRLQDGSCLMDVRVVLSKEETMLDEDPQTREYAEAALAHLRSISEICALDAGMKFVLSDGQDVKLELNDSIERQNDPIFEIAKLNHGYLPGNIAKRMNWFAEHGHYGVSLTNSGVAINKSPCNQLRDGQTQLRIVAGPGMLDHLPVKIKTWVYPACRYSALVSPSDIDKKNRNRLRVRTEMRIPEGLPKIRFVRKKERLTYRRLSDTRHNRGYVGFQYDLTKTQGGENYNEMVSSEKKYELEFEVTSFQKYESPKEATFTIMREIVDIMLLRNKCKIKAIRNHLKYLNPPDNGTYMCKKGSESKADVGEPVAKRRRY